MNQPNPTQTDRIDLKSLENRQSVLQFELKLLEYYGPSLSVYILPNIRNQAIWNGVIFIRHGCFRDGKFKFMLDMTNFPTNQPRIHFLTKIYHPYIKQQNGQLDISSILDQQWDYGQSNMLYNIMKGMKKTLQSKDTLTHTHSFNPKAAELYIDNFHQFLVKAIQSVNHSRQIFTVNTQQFSLHFSEEMNEEMLQIKQKLLSIVKQPCQLPQKIQKFIQSLSI